MQGASELKGLDDVQKDICCIWLNGNCVILEKRKLSFFKEGEAASKYPPTANVRAKCLCQCANVVRRH